MAVRVCFRVPRQLQFRHDSSNHVLVSENAAVGEERESPGLCVVNDATAGELFVFRFSGNLAPQPPLFPNVDVAPRIGQEIAVVLGCSQRRAVDKRRAVNEPKDAHSRLSRPCGCLALSAFMRFLHWLILAADRSDGHAILPALLNPRWHSVAASHGTSRQTNCREVLKVLRGGGGGEATSSARSGDRGRRC